MPQHLARLLLAVLLALVGCRTSLDMSVGELARLGDDEGLVVGSVLLALQPAAGEAPPPRSGIGPEAERGSYSLLVRRGAYMGDDGHSITVLPGEERAFVAKLPDGDYTIYEVKQTFSRLRAELDVRFSVRDGRTTYIGRLVIFLPARLQPGMPIGVRAEDRLQRDLELLSEEQRELVGEPDKRLMTLP